MQKKIEEGAGQDDDGIDVNMDIDSMPDCRLKYQIIVKRANQGMGKFEDAQFKANNKAIGDEVLGNLGISFKWPRMSDSGLE